MRARFLGGIRGSVKPPRLASRRRCLDEAAVLDGVVESNKSRGGACGLGPRLLVGEAHDTGDQNRRDFPRFSTPPAPPPCAGLQPSTESLDSARASI
jgi:hypothetical protein